MPIDPESLHDQDWREGKGSDTFFEGAARYPDISEVILRLRPKKLLDVGCGSGYLARLLKTHRPDLTIEGVDISGEAIKRARPHLEKVWKVDLDREDLPTESSRYDTVVCIEVLEHLYDPDHAIVEIFRVLHPGGRAVFTVPNLAYWRYRLHLLLGRVPPPAVDRRHLHQFNLQLLYEALVGRGFQVLGCIGHGIRLKWLARQKPALFSDILIATALKP